MKRFFTFLAATAMSVATIFPAKAQLGDGWSIKAGAGWFSIPDVVGLLLAGFGAIDTEEGTSNKSFVPMVSPSVELHYQFNDWFALGGSLAVGYAQNKSVFDSSNIVNKEIWTLYPTLCVNALTNYYQNDEFTLYGSWGVGVMVLFCQQRGESITDKSVKCQSAFMGNCYPLGLAFDLRPLFGGSESNGRTALTLEAGWGAKGIASLGLCHNF